MVLKGSLYLDDNSVQFHVTTPAPGRDLLRVGVGVGEPLVGGHLPPPPLLVVLQKVASELHPKVCNHGEGPY